MTCTRCGGLAIHDYFYGATDYFAWQCHGFRCLNCGSVTNIHPIEPTSSPRHASRARRDKRRQNDHHHLTSTTMTSDLVHEGV